MYKSLLPLVLLSIVECGGKLAPLPATTDTAPVPSVPPPSPTPPPPPEVAEAGANDAEADAPSVELDDAEIACEAENAPPVTLEEYGNLLCHALVACAGTGASSSQQDSFDSPGGAGCTALIVGRALAQQINPSCVNACALYLESIQQGGAGCQALLQGGPRECNWAVEPTFVYCSRAQGRVGPSEAAGRSDGVWCPSDEQCVTGVAPFGCQQAPPTGTPIDPTCAAAESAWVCLD
jgi:hypothetical protein